MIMCKNCFIIVLQRNIMEEKKRNIMETLNIYQ